MSRHGAHQKSFSKRELCYISGSTSMHQEAPIAVRTDSNISSDDVVSDR